MKAFAQRRRVSGPVRRLVLAIALLIGGQAGARAAELAFVMPNSPTPYLLPFIIAQDLKWYEQAGLKVEEKVVTGDANALRALLSGGADVTYMGTGTIMQASVTGARLSILASWQSLVDYLVVARSGITSLEELKDKKWASVGAGSMTQAVPEMLLQKHGIDHRGAQFLGVGGLAARYQAVLGGTVDATILDTYFATLAERSGKARIVASVLKDLPGLGYNYVVTTQKIAETPAQRKALEIFVGGAQKGVRYILDQPEAAARILVARLKDGDAELITAVLKTMTGMGVWAVNGGLERTVFDTTAQFYQKVGMLSGQVDYDKLVDPGVLEPTLRELGRR